MNDEIKEYVIKFHNTYEKLAPNYGYETRKDTKELNFNSNNGKLMYATINEIITPLLDDITNLQQENEVLENEKDMFYKVSQERLNKWLSLNDENNKLVEIIKDYKSRIEKAVEYIKTELVDEWSIKNGGCVSGSDLPVDAITPLLNILNGKGDE